MSYLILFVISLLFSGLFSGFEIAFVTVNRGKFLLWFRGRIADFLLRRPHEVITTILIGNNLANITAVVSITELVQRWTPSGAQVVPLAGLIATVTILFFGEIVPKALFRAHAPWAIRWITPVIYTLYLLTWPAVRGLGSAVRGLLGAAPGTSRDEGELEKVILWARKLGTLEPQEAQFLSTAFQALNQKLTDFVEPREKLLALPVDLPPKKALKRAQERKQRRFLVYEGTLDNILGYVHIKDLLLTLERSSISRRFIKPVAVVLENWTLLEALQAMQKLGTPVATVVDEYGGTVGAIWITRILDVLLEKRESQPRKEIPLDPATSLNRVRELLGIPLEETRAETLAGFLAESLGRVPKKGDRIIAEGWAFEVLEADATHVKKIVARRIDAQNRSSGKTARPGGRSGSKRGTQAGGRPPGVSPP